MRGDTSQPRLTRIALLGRQGSGKGTQGRRLAAEFDMAHVSAGDLLRRAVANREPLGPRVAAFLEAGDLVPDAVVCEVVATGMVGASGRVGVVLDGFPRTVAQANLLEAMVGSPALDVVLELVVDEALARQRLLARRVCPTCGRAATGTAETCPSCGDAFARRADDTPDAIRRRFAFYDDLTRPVLGWYGQRGRLASVNGSGPEESVFAALADAVRAVLPVDLRDKPGEEEATGPASFGAPLPG